MGAGALGRNENFARSGDLRTGALDSLLQKNRMIHRWRFKRMLAPLNARARARFDVEENTPPGHSQGTKYEGNGVVVPGSIKKAVIGHRRNRHGIALRDLRIVVAENRLPFDGRKSQVDLGSL